MKRGKVVKSEGISMPDGKTMKNIYEGGCNYPESLETYGVNLEEMKGKIRKHFIRKAKNILN